MQALTASPSFWVHKANFWRPETAFDNAIPFYNDIQSASGQQAQRKSCYHTDQPLSNRVRQRKMIWFNPSYKAHLETNVGKTFLKFIDKHFPKAMKFHKIFNKNNVKVSYSCLTDFVNMIKSRNNKILPEKTVHGQPKCNC